MKIGFVVQRFGPGVEGGAERHCLELATRLQAGGDDVQILTSTALHMGRWHQSHFLPGPDTYEGLSVRRFAVEDHRGPGGVWYKLLRERAKKSPRSLTEQWAWLEAQGPTCPDLIAFLEDHREDYDVFVFFTYLYPPTAIGLLRVADRALLVPTAHDEPPLKREVFRPLFLAPRAILFNTEEERALVHARFHNAHVPSFVGGVGIDEPPPAEAGAEPAPADIVYLGRIDDHKLFDLVPLFRRYAERNAEARLVLVGKPYTKLPEHPRIVAPGFVSEAEKWRLLRSAKAFVMPSEFESLSIVLLEAWAVGTPALVNGRCAVLKGHVERSGGGLSYTDYASFEAGLDTLLTDPGDRGARGREYVRAHYRWDAIMDVVREALAAAAG